MRTRFLAPLMACTLLPALGCPAVSIDEDGGGDGPSAVETSTSDTSSGTASSGGSEATETMSDPGSTGPGGSLTGGNETDTGTTSPLDLPSDGSCDPLAQDCPAGEKCTFHLDDAHPEGANECVPVTGKQQPGDECMTLDDHSDTCVEGSLCWGPAPDGLCHEICDEDLECASGDPCTVMYEGALPLCLFDCDPVQQGCPTGWGCYDDAVPPDDWLCLPDASGELGQYGDPCEGFDRCDPGLACVPAEQVASSTCSDSGADYCCAEICYLPMPSDCPSLMETCVSIYPGPPPPEFDHVGVCAL